MGDRDNYNYASRSSNSALNKFEPVDFMNFLKKPHVILRLFCLLFAIIVASTIGSQGWEADMCKFNLVSSSCNYGTFMGVASIFILIPFLGLDSQFHVISDQITKKYVLIADIVVSGMMSFLWFACFCDLTDKWRRLYLSIENLGGGASAIRAIIFFAFFSFAGFVAICVFAVRKYRESGLQQFQPQYQQAEQPQNQQKNQSLPSDDPFTLQDDDLSP